MLILGTMFCGGNLACAMTPTDINDITYVALQNGMYDDLYATEETSSEPTDTCPENYDFDTIFHAKFNNTTDMGNIEWSLSTVSHILIKRRREDSFTWQTIFVKEINSVEDFNIQGIDYTNESNVKYEYAVVPSLYGSEGNYSLSKVGSKFDGIYVVEKDKMYGTILTDGFCDTTRNFPSSTVVTINNRKPVDINTSVANYDSGTCTGNWLRINETNCELMNDDYSRIKYQKEIIDFLSDRKPKLLKCPDGRMWLIKVEDQITDNADTIYNNRNISFNWTEIGDHTSAEDLYYADLSDVSEEYWG